MQVAKHATSCGVLRAAARLSLPAPGDFQHNQFMKTLITFAVLVASLSSGLAAESSVKGRRLGEINLIPQRVLQRGVSPEFFKSLVVSPLDGWITARGNLNGTKLAAIKITRSDLGGLYDPLALQLAKEVKLMGNDSLGRPSGGEPVLVHLLVYQIADATMVLSFIHLDGAGGNQDNYWGCARILVLKDDKWTEIQGPASLQGKGVAVRRGGKNSGADALRVERLSSTGPEAVNYGGAPGSR
jgi:hypothetical protein